MASGGGAPSNVGLLAGSATLGRSVVVAVVALPALCHALGHGTGNGNGDLSGAGGAPWIQALLVALAFALPIALARRDGKRGAERTFTRGIALAFALPLVPVVLHVFPFEIERVLLHGTLAALALFGGLGRAWRGLRGAHGAARWAVLALLGWAAWSLGSAALGFGSAWPSGAGFGTALWGALGEVLWRDALVPRPQIEALQPVRALFLRLEVLAVVAVALGLALERLDGGRQLLREAARASALALILGFGMAWIEMARASLWRGESFFARVDAGLGRMHRPLLDNNALGSALLVWLPLAAALSAGHLAHRLLARRAAPGSLAGRGSVAALGAVAFAAGVFLLTTSRSKAALGGAALAFGATFVATLGARRMLRSPFVLVPLIAVVAAVAAVQVLPAQTVGAIASQSRYAEDAVRILRFDAAIAYLRQNRSGPWIGALELTGREPLFGHGLGSFPRALATVHDPKRKVAFNPRHENAHNQVLQWSAEEGLLGAALGVAIVLLALCGGWRATVRARASAPGLFDAEAFENAVVPGALIGLAVNVQLGHPLLEHGAAYPIALLIGLGLGGLVRGAGPRTDVPRAFDPRRAGCLGAALAALALVGLPPLALFFRERPPLETAQVGCFPWVERRGVPPRDRLLCDDAHWIEVWGAGSRILIPVRDVRPVGFERAMTVDLWIDGQEVLRDVVLPAAPHRQAGAPAFLLKADAPRPIAPGERIALRLIARPPYAETLQFATGRYRIGVRAGQAAFVDPR